MHNTRKTLNTILSGIVILSMAVSLARTEFAYAQGRDGLKLERNTETGRVNFITSESGRPMIASQALDVNPGFLPPDPAMALAQRYAPEFGIQNAATELTAMKTDRADDGRMTVRYQQQYQGIPVMGGELIVNTNENGDLYSIVGWV